LPHPIVVPTIWSTSADVMLAYTQEDLPDTYYPSGESPHRTTLSHDPVSAPAFEMEANDPDSVPLLPAATRDDASGSSEDDVCYICLDGEGPLLINVCDCVNSRVHRSCLLKLHRAMGSVHPSQRRCGVCKATFKNYEGELAPLRRPDVGPRRYACACVAVLTTLTGAAMMLMGTMADGADAKRATFLIIGGLLVTVQSMYATRMLMDPCDASDEVQPAQAAI
jgi:hypothetical protein